MGIAIPQLAPASLDRTSGAQVIDGSLKFNASAHLTRTPSSAGNRNTWTWSGWVKRSDVATSGNSLFAAYDSSTVRDVLRFDRSASGAELNLQSSQSGSTYGIYSNSRLRDTGWYHVVAIYDDAASTTADKQQLYVNGERVTSVSTENNGQDGGSTTINNTDIHYIGARSSDGNPSLQFDGAMSQVYLIDGAALEPENFGFTDPLTNIWKPKKYKHDKRFYGVTFSNQLSPSDGPWRNSNPKSNGFDGSASTSIALDTVEGTLTFSPNFGEGPFEIEYKGFNDGQTTATIDGTALTYTSGSIWTGTVNSFNTLTLVAGANNRPGITYIKVNGYILVDAAADNSFYLPFDGNTPIGKDQIGNGNDWTPVNFGGSVELDNPNVSGARPILNTTQGGAQAGVGVFGSKQNVGYAVTVYNDGGGNKYYIDGVKQDTLTGLIRGAKYTFDTSDSTVSSHPFRFSATSNGSHGGGSEYTSGVVAITGAATTITVPHDAPNTLYYYCTSHSGMGADITGITTNEKLADQYASSIQLSVDHAGSAVDNTMAFNGSANKMSSFSANNSTYASTVAGQGSPYNSALYINGTGDYPRINFTAGDFNFMHNQDDSGTVEFWFYNGAYSTEGYIFANVGESSEVGLALVMGSATTFNCYIQRGVSGGSQNAGSSPLPQNKWSHIAVTKQKVGSNVELKVYVDGVNTASNTSITATDLSNSNSQKTYWQTGSSIGHESSRGFTNAYISDIRIYNIVKYTSDFIVPSTSPDIIPDTPSGVAGGSKLTKITDGAVHFDGTGDFLGLANSTDTNFGSGDFTVECYAYFTDVTAETLLGQWENGSNRRSWLLQVNSGQLNCYLSADGTTSGQKRIDSAAGAISTNRWYHLAYARSGDTMRLFIDGEQVGSVDVDGFTNYANTDDGFQVGSQTAAGSNLMNGFISNARIIKGTGIYTSNFKAPTAPLTNVTNTVLLCCQSNTSATEAAVTPGSITANGDAAATNFNPFITDINTVRGQETGYATLNPLWKNTNASNTGGTFTDGNLNHTTAGSNGNTPTCANIYASSGKFYWEVTLTSGSTFGIGVASDYFSSADYPGYGTNADTGQVSWGYNQNGEKIHNATSTSSYGSSYTVGDTIGVAMNLDAGELEYYKNGVSQGVAFTDLEGNLTACHADTGSAAGFSYNFGQKPFKFPPPDGFQPLNAANTRPETVIARPDQYVGVVTYTSDSSNPISIRSFNFKPDMVWGKDRDGNNNWHQFDSVRGPDRSLDTSGNGGESDWSSYFLSFDDNGFTVAAGDHDLNRSTNKMCAWAWKAGGAPTADNTQTSGAMTANSVSLDGVLQSAYTPSGSPSTYPKRMSIGTKQGFSIVQFVGNATNRTLPHGLGRPAKFMIVKNMDTGSTGWAVYHDAIGATETNNYIEISNGSAGQDDTAFQDTAPTADLFSIGTKAATNNDTDNTIAWIWADVPGLQKFGQFEGNGNDNGPFIELGFRPAILMLKCVDNSGDSYDWRIIDTARELFNNDTGMRYLIPHKGDNEANNSPIDFLSNGFKIRKSTSEVNENSHTFVYAAWAEAPSIDLYGGGANAR